MAQTILVMAGYQPAAEWICRCLEVDGFLPVRAKDADEALRMALLLEIDLIVAWPAISGCRHEEVLAAVGGHPRADGIPVLFAAFQRPWGLRPMDDWIKVPLAADELRRKVCCLLDRALPRDLKGPTPCPSHERSKVPVTVRVVRPSSSRHPVATLRQAALPGVRRRYRLGRR